MVSAEVDGFSSVAVMEIYPNIVHLFSEFSLFFEQYYDNTFSQRRQANEGGKSKKNLKSRYFSSEKSFFVEKVEISTE